VKREGEVGDNLCVLFLLLPPPPPAHLAFSLLTMNELWPSLNMYLIFKNCCLPLSSLEKDKYKFSEFDSCLHVAPSFSIAQYHLYCT